MVKAVIFDLDGTLCDTVEDLADAVNYALFKVGCPNHTTENIKTFIGNGNKNLIIKSLPEGKSDINTVSLASDFFFEYYRAHFADKTKAFFGIDEILCTLKQNGVKLAVCTNKEEGMAKAVVKSLFGDLFDIVIGNSDRFPLKPAPDSSIHIMESLGVKREEILFIGDSDVDIITAKNAGVMSVGVTWGFRSKEELVENGCNSVAEQPYDIIRIIGKVEEKQ